MPLVAHTSQFRNDVIAETPNGERLRDCIQCGTCGGSCPNGADMESTPRHIFALINAGMRDRVLSANTMWRCVSCYLCTSRCPQNIPVTDLMYTLKRMSIREGHSIGSDAPALARTFTGYVDRYGRSFEFGLASRYYLTHKPASLLRSGPLGASMLKRGRLSLRPTRIRQVEQLQAIIKKAREARRCLMKYAFYPGCSLESSSVAYDRSVRAVAARLDLELQEVDDWNCCGATEYYTLDKLAACSVIARNLALVDPGLDQLVAPCSACYLNLKKIDRLMTEHPALGQQINEALAAGDLGYEAGRVKVRHLLDVLHTDVGESAIREQVVRPLEGLRVAPYYGCQVVRPLNGFDDPEYPVRMDEMLGWLGAEAVDYPVKSHCCGGHLTQISEEQSFELIRRLLQSAADYKADVIACLCPMCQLNLDAYQGRVNNFFNTRFELPVLFFTQLLGLAFGLDRKTLGLGKELVPAEPVLATRLDAVSPEPVH